MHVPHGGSRSRIEGTVPRVNEFNKINRLEKWFHESAVWKLRPSAMGATCLAERVCPQPSWGTAKRHGFARSNVGGRPVPWLQRGLLLALAAAMPALFLSGIAAAATLKIATLSPEGSVWMKMLRDGAEQVEAETAGRVSFKFYPGGVMGDDKAVVRKIRVGQLQGAVVTSGALVQTYPDIGLYSLPMAFASGDEADYVRSRMDVALLDGLKDRGFVAFGIAEVGFAHAMSQSVMTSVEDARALKVWVPDNDPGSAQAFGAFGIAAIPLPISDVLSGLQTGLIDSVATPPVAAIALQWHTQLDHIMDLPMVYIYGLFAVAGRAFDRIAPADQAVMQRVMGGVVKAVDARSRSDNEQAMGALRKQGLVWNETAESERQEWQRLADLASLRMAEEGFVSTPRYREMLDHVEAYRSSAD